jgi:hypothetical protein
MTRREAVHAGLVALAMFVLYALTASHTVGLEDDGLFILSSYFLGIEHPPGYPLFTLVGHLFSQMPFGSVAYRVHLASALFGALSCGAAWLCARVLTGRVLAAYLAALALGLSPVFWSQAIIAEVYTLNTFFFLLLAWLALQPRPNLPWIALIFGLSLSNHYPLMLLVAPGFAVLLWPWRWDMARRAPQLAWLLILGLLPYVWLVWHSLSPLPVSFYGPLDTLYDVWYFVSRAGYAEVDHSASAGWLDHVKFFRFFIGQLLLQFALLGTAVAVGGFAVQWRRLGPRVGAFLTLAFLGPSVGLLLLLGFDYSSIQAHVFHVYPLPAYAVAALWLAVGFAWTVEHYALRPVPAALAAGGLLVIVFGVGARTNVFADQEWGARYARTLLRVLPPNAVVFTRGEADLGPLAYFHMIVGERPDITLYQTKGLALGNRLFKPTQTDEAGRQRALGEAIERQTDPVVFTLETFGGYASVDRWLYVAVDKSDRDRRKVTVDVPPEALEFFERDVAVPSQENAWVAFFQGQLRRRYGEVLARSLERGRAPDERTRHDLELLSKDFYGALGIAEGLIHNPGGYSVAEVGRFLDRARDSMPSDVAKDELARFFHLRASVRASIGDEAGAVRDFETALAVWPAPDNPAVEPLEELYAKAGNTRAAEALRARLKSAPVLRP